MNTGELVRASSDADGHFANNYSSSPSLSPSGHFVAFYSSASDLVPGGENSQRGDVYVKDIETGEIVRASTSATGILCNGYSALPQMLSDHVIAFRSEASNLVAGDTNGKADYFIKDVATDAISRIVLPTDAYEVSFSADASTVVFSTDFAKDVFAKNLATGKVVRVDTDAAGNRGNSSAGMPSVSDDGRYVAFRSEASNLVPGDSGTSSDIFVKDLLTGELIAASSNATGQLGNGNSWYSDISADGRYVAFLSYATNLVPNDTDGEPNIFVKDLVNGEILRMNTGAAGIDFDLSSDGRFVAFHLGTEVFVKSVGSSIIGTSAADQITASFAADTISGADGNDLINGKDGNDLLNGNVGDDTVNGDDGNDSVLGGLGHDWVFGGAGNDTVQGQDGNDSLRGDAGNDVLFGQAGNDTLDSGDGNDTAGGSDGHDLLLGGDGNDSLAGGDGNDFLFGGTGAGTLDGGAGYDRFVFLDTSHSPVGSGHDVVTAFDGIGAAAGDRIDVSGMDANPGVAGDQAFSFIGTAAFGNVAGQLHAVATNGGADSLLQGDINGDGVADFEILVKGTAAAAWVASDFIL